MSADLRAAQLDRESTWWSLVMGAAASIEDAAACLRDEDAKRQAEGAAKHYRESAKRLSALAAAEAQPVQEPIAEVRDGCLCWHIPHPTYAVAQKYRTGRHLLYAAPPAPPAPPAQAAQAAQPLTDSMGMPTSCGKPLCSPDDHHPLCPRHGQRDSQPQPLTDEALARIAYKGYDDYWDEQSLGRETEAWAASARAVLAAAGIGAQEQPR